VLVVEPIPMRGRWGGRALLFVEDEDEGGNAATAPPALEEEEEEVEATPPSTTPPPTATAAVAEEEELCTVLRELMLSLSKSAPGPSVLLRNERSCAAAASALGPCWCPAVKRGGRSNTDEEEEVEDDEDEEEEEEGAARWDAAPISSSNPSNSDMLIWTIGGDKGSRGQSPWE
jgi:hypothetical protein